MRLCRIAAAFVASCASSCALAGATLPPIVFVQRQIPDNGSIYWDAAKDLPGVGAHSRVRPAAPGYLRVRETDGSVRTLVDGAHPTAASFELIDVNAPAVSWDGATIAFAGLPSGTYDTAPARTLGAWRLYLIDADGGNLRELTFTDMSGDYAQFGPWDEDAFQAYDDYDPAFLPDGRIVFSSTRWPGYGHYSGVRASNLWVVDADGTHLHRVTSERNGADRPLADPVTGKIVYARWWRNHRFATDSMASIGADCQASAEQHPDPCYAMHDGLTTDRNVEVGGADNLFRNAWQIATINPDGTDLSMWSGVFRDEEANHIYGAGFAYDGSLFANFFPMYNMTEAAGFGGIRRYVRAPIATRYQPVNGVFAYTDASGAQRPYAHGDDPSNYSYGIFVPPPEGYTVDPEVLPPQPQQSMTIVYSAAPDWNQDYDLWVSLADGSARERITFADAGFGVGTSELRARVLVARTPPPVLPDPYRDDWDSAPHPQFLPPTGAGPYDRDGTFVFDDLNVYFNAPVDTDIVSAPPVGLAATIRFFADFQRRSTGSFPQQDWPILLDELAIAPNGRVVQPNAPAFLPLFEQIRSSAATGYRVPETGTGEHFLAHPGAAHVAGMNFDRAGAHARCVGCHAGHSQIPVPANDADAEFTNLAPGATLRVSSTRDAGTNDGLIDRRVMKGEIWRYWNSDPGEPQDGQWIELRFPVPVSVRTVRLYDPRPGDEANSSIHVAQATVRLYADDAASDLVGTAVAQDVAVAGTDVAFADVAARVVRVDLDDVGGTFYGLAVAALAEIEVIARGEAIMNDDTIFRDGFDAP
ncbi:MAG TPA: hypothetical protein VKB52_10815 [Rhodanobacteraceae bacterium]|nr:hypothetical protein [Rhodanobacteraceae bacterium]